MVKSRKKLQELIEFTVNVGMADIDGGVACNASKCMHKVAIARTLDKIDPKFGHHKVRVDAGLIKFNMGGFRWEGKTPKPARRTLIMFDNEKTRPEVKPHSYKVVAARTTKIKKVSPERQRQINEARRQRIANGIESRSPTAYRLRDRIVGFDLGRG